MAKSLGKYISIYGKLSNSIKTTCRNSIFSNTKKHDCSILIFRGDTADCRYG